MKSQAYLIVRKFVKQQFPYIAISLLLLLSAYPVGSFMIGNFTKSNSEIKSLETEVKDLTGKKEAFDKAIFEVSDSLDEDNKLMTSLIPDSEDYFTLIYSLDQLSQKSSFLITDYAVDLKASTSEKLSLTVKGVGDGETFKSFLQDYNLSSGRLITIDTMSVDAKTLGTEYTLLLNFYNKEVSTEFEGNKSYKVSVKDLQEIRSKVSFVLTSEDVNRELDNDYPKKDNPF
ncbi:MAG: hypothetical protein AAB966_01135 [Patescibacteria group bacterium]